MLRLFLLHLTMAKFGKRSIEKLCGVAPKLSLLMELSIKDTPIDFGIDAGIRTAEKQAEYYSWGRTKMNPNTGAIKGNKYGMQVTKRDGYLRKSNHQVKSDGFSHAVDIYPFYNGSLQTTDVKSLKKVIDHVKKIAKENNIKCKFGIDWTSPRDPPHIELA